MSNYWEDSLFPQFLDSIDSCTLSDLTTYQIQSELNNLAIRAVTDFMFPQYSLAYTLDVQYLEDPPVLNPLTGVGFGYYFDSTDVGQKEYNVILARMKQYWVEFQISQERLFANAYYDKEIRLHSPGNTIDKLLKMFTTFKTLADVAEYKYNRTTIAGDSGIGEVNDD